MSNNARLFAFLLLIFGAVANVYAADAVHFTDLKMPVPPGDVGVAFMNVTSDADDAITGAKSACCAAVELHRSSMANGVMQMRSVDSVPLAAHQAVAFAPGGLHVMLIGEKKPLKIGSQVPVTFSFAHAPAQTVLFTVSAPRLPASAASSKSAQ